MKLNIVSGNFAFEINLFLSILVASMNSQRNKLKNNDVFTYRRLRRAIGYLGLFLPVVLIGLSLFSYFKTDLQPSISHYYYTNFRDIFTGTLSAVGLFLISYKGHGNVSIWKNDQLLTNVAGIMAVGIALIPVNPELEHRKIYTLIPYLFPMLGWLHYIFAAAMFGIFSLLAINVFTIGQNKDESLPQSTLNENNIYIFCGISILILLVMIPVFEIFKIYTYATLILESIILFLFGIAWLIKGRVLGDEGKIGMKLYNERNEEHTENTD